MRKSTSIILGLLSLASTFASAQCSDPERIRALDAEWELALNTGDRSAVSDHVHPDFVWVHNHAGSIQESKQEFLNFFDQTFGRASMRPSTQRPGIRTQREVKVLINPGSAIVYGITNIKRGGTLLSEPDNRPIITYHFMRTYIPSGGECLLVSNHTMEIPQDDPGQ